MSLRSTSVALAVVAALALAPTPALVNDDAYQLRALYSELQDFKHDLIFKTVGFGVGYRFHDWLQRVEALKGGDTAAYAQQFGLLPGELALLATEYMHGRGSGEVARMWESMVVADRTSTARVGRVIGRWCYPLGAGYSACSEIRRVTGAEYRIYTNYSDGSHGSSAFRSVNPKRGEKLRLRPKSGYDSYVVHDDNTLGIYDDQGLFVRGRPE